MSYDWSGSSKRPKRPNPVAIPCSTKSLGVGERRLLSPDEVLAEFPEPNRFDPFEALDTIENITLESRDTRVILGDGDLGVIQRRVLALRAYITGMER